MTKKMSSVHYQGGQSCAPVARVSCARVLAYSCPHQLLVKWNLGLRCCHLRQEGRKGFDEIEETDFVFVSILGPWQTLGGRGSRTTTHGCYNGCPRDNRSNNPGIERVVREVGRRREERGERPAQKADEEEQAGSGREVSLSPESYGLVSGARSISVPVRTL